MIRICRYIRTHKNEASPSPRVGLIEADERVVDLGAAGLLTIGELLTRIEERPRYAEELLQDPVVAGNERLSDYQLLPPVDQQEIWAAGVTYLRSRAARIQESDFSGSAYDLVYEAKRPELFFKALPDKVVGPMGAVGIRSDARWNVPEPELALLISPGGHVAGFGIGNDMSSRDIEGENLLYLPQAKVYDRSCSIGPWWAIGLGESEARRWPIRLRIERDRQAVFAGETSIDQIRRPFDELTRYLMRCQRFPHGVVLLTGTGIVPEDSFSLREGDTIEITIPDVGTLTNPVVRVH